jgi:voltage-gated potassium channel
MCADTFWGSAFEKFIFFLIFVNIATFIASTVNSLEQSATVQITFNWIEVISVSIFTVEYLLRVWAVVEEEDYADPVKGRINYMTSFFGLVDLCAILPFYVELIVEGGLPDPANSDDDFSLTFIRVFRLVRVLKAEKYMESLTLLDDVVRANKGLIAVTGFVSMLMWVVMGVGFYVVQSEHDCLALGEDLSTCVVADLYSEVHHTNYFGTIADSLWPTLLMLSSEFPLADFNLGGALLGILMVLFAVGLFGNFIGIIADGFETVFGERAAIKKKTKNVKFHCADCNTRITHFYWMDLDAFK